MIFFVAGVDDSGPPEPGLRPGLDEAEVTPGIEGFLLTGLMVVLAVIAIRLMIRSVRRVKLRSETAEDMLVERHQDYLDAEQRKRPEDDALAPHKVQDRLKSKYPGYLSGPPPVPKSPDSGRDH